MKFAFAGLFLFAFLALAASSQYVELTKTQISKNSQFLADLQAFGVGYVVQKGVYERDGNPLPGENYNLTTVEKIERRSTKTAAYYRFTVLLTEQQEQARARATFTIKYDHRNGAFVVSSYKYTVIENVYEGYTENYEGLTENYEYLPENYEYGFPEEEKGYYAYIVIDVRPFNADILDEVPAFKARVQEIVAKGIKRGVLPKSTYKIGFTYSGLYDPYTQRKFFYVKVENAKGKVFRIEFDYYSPPATDNGNYSRIQKNFSWKK